MEGLVESAVALFSNWLLLVDQTVVYSLLHVYFETNHFI